ncbi:MAG TPA: helix-turn-helix transcriptional regulator [Jiangellaceae bacterium]|nr:helix-turn-helix transcriptional regulator [Jiangellaceae bacterium]
MDAGSRFVVTMSGAARLVRDDEPIYVISVAAEMAGMHPQTLRQYDRLGLVSPGRSVGGGRRYSLRDVELLREVQRLSQDDGVNLAGIKRILELEAQADALRERLAELGAEYSWLAARLSMSSHLLTRWPTPRMLT